MSISPDFDRYPHGCEVVIPIVLRIPIYIEPVVIERAARCYDAQSEVADLKKQLLTAEPMAQADDGRAVANLTMDSSDMDAMGLVNRSPLQPVAKSWHSFSQAIQDLFETGMAGRSRFLQ